MVIVTIWIKDKTPGKPFQPVCSAAQVTVDGVCVRELGELRRSAFPNDALSALVVHFTAILRELPDGASVTVISDQDSFVRAWAEGWLKDWKAEGFRLRPSDPKAWKALSDLIDAKGIAVAARLGTKDAADREVMKALKRRLDGKRDIPPGDEGVGESWSNARIEEKHTDSLRQRATGKDPWEK